MINRVTLLGNLGAEPEVVTTKTGTPMTTLALATSNKWKDKHSGEYKEETEWHRVVLFNRTAEVAAEYLHKGSQIYIEGAIKTNKWVDETGADRYSTEIHGHILKMLSKAEAPVPSFEPDPEAPIKKYKDIKDEDIPF